MSLFYGIIVLVVLGLLFVYSYYLNNKTKIDCDRIEMCEGCKENYCCHKMNKEE